MSERIDKLMQAAGLKENVLNSLERGDSMFVLTDQTLLFEDSGGTRRVTLRDLKRIHSDQDGLLRVETPAGTALTANLLGFDPAAVQAFFAQVRDATAKAKQQAGTTTITPETAATSVRPAAVPAAQSPSTQPPSAQTPATQTPSVQTPAASSGATWTGADKPAVPSPAAPVTPPVASASAGAASTERPASIPSTPPARSVAAPRANTESAPAAASGSGLGLSSSTPSAFTPTPPPPPAFKPQEAQATVKPVVKAVRTPTVITDPDVLSRAETTPLVEKPAVESAPVRPEPVTAPAPRVNGSAVGTLASLAAVAGGVSGWIGALKAMSLVMLLATFGMTYFLYDRGEGINGFWTLIAGGMGAVALWALSDVVKLLVSLAQAVSAEGGVMDVD